MSKPSASLHLSQKHLPQAVPFDGLIPDPIHSGHSKKKLNNFSYATSSSASCLFL